MVLPINGGGQEYVWHIVQLLSDIADRIDEAGANLAEVPVIGPIVAPIFYSASRQVDNVRLWLYNFFYAYGDVITAIKALLDGEELSVILDWLFPDWRLIRDYPLDWILDRIDSVMPSISTLVFAPVLWLRDLLLLAFPDAGDFLLDPAPWLIHFLLSINLSWGEFIDDPEAYVIYLISRYVGDWGEFIIDPFSFVQAVLNELLGLPPDFWLDPIGSLVGMLLRILDDNRQELKAQILDVGERLVRTLWEGV